MVCRVLGGLLVGIVLVSGACWGDRTPVTLSAKNTSVRPLVEHLLQRTGCSYVVGDDVPDDYIRSIVIRDVPFDVVLKSFARWWKVNCEFEDRMCCVSGPGADRIEPEIRDESPGIPDSDRNTYYLVRRREEKADEPPVRVALGPRQERVEEALVDYAGTLSRVVTPELLDDLALRLRRQVDANPDLREKISHEQIGLAKFRPIGAESRAVVADLAEDLSTSMVKAGFNLVERAQLDKACDELRLQDTGLIDPVTAGRIGQMTGCGVIVVGSVSDRGNMVVINARLVETSTGRALAADRVTAPI